MPSSPPFVGRGIARTRTRVTLRERLFRDILAMNLSTLLCTSALMAAGAYPIYLLIRNQPSRRELDRQTRRDEPGIS